MPTFAATPPEPGAAGEAPRQRPVHIRARLRYRVPFVRDKIFMLVRELPVQPPEPTPDEPEPEARVPVPFDIAAFKVDAVPAEGVRVCVEFTRRCGCIASPVAPASFRALPK